MTVISEVSFEVQCAGGWRQVPAGTYELNLAVRKHSTDVGWVPGKTVIITPTEIHTETNYLSPIWLGIWFMLLYSFWCGLRFRA